MAQSGTDLALRVSVTVNAPVERAFEVFTARMGAWWPLESHHIAEVKAADAVVEPRAGGRWFERGVDGSECDWGRVRAWEPPHRVVLGWHLDADWHYDPDEANATEVEVSFLAEGPSTTTVVLEHRGLERYGDRAEELKQALSSDDAWSGLLQLYRSAVES